MDIVFRNRKLEKDCNEYQRLVKRYGSLRAKLIDLRLRQLRAAQVLEHVATLPQVRCHELVGDRKGELSVDVGHPYRLLFVPADEPRPTRPEGGLDWARVSRIEIIGVEDTHG
jgi:plasmid maintenance system killer protein